MMKENLKDLRTNAAAIIVAVLTLLCAVDDFSLLERFRWAFIGLGVVLFLGLVFFASSEITPNLDKFVDLLSKAEQEMKQIEATDQTPGSVENTPKKGLLSKLGFKVKL